MPNLTYQNRKAKWITWICVLGALACCALFSPETRYIKTRWENVPPAPSLATGMMYGFGDKQLAYYSLVLTLQNMGDIGGRMTALRDYNMDNVAEWLRLTAQFDRDSRYAPMLAGYYFGASQDPSKIRPLINYLRVVGDRPDRDLWRFLAQAVYLARFRLKDQELALDMAYQLAALQGPDIPMWAKQMPAFVMSRVGQKEASRDLFLALMATSRNLSRQELNFMCGYIQDNLRELHDGLDQNAIWKAFCKGRKF